MGTRADFSKKFEELIESYNAGSRTIEALYQELLDLSHSLDTGSQQGKDVDVLGVRFPFRRENRQRPMIDSDLFRRHGDKAYVALAEIKTGVCRLNGPWTAPERENMQRVLSALGMLAPHEIDFAVQEIYDKGHFESQLYYVSMVCFGEETGNEITDRYPTVP